jgi:acyl dehydratase
MTRYIDPAAHEDTIGRVETYEIGLVSRQDARRYARAVEDDNPLFHNVEYARERGYDDLVVPPNYLSAVIDPTEGTPVDALRDDGLDPTQFHIPMPETAVLMGGGQDLTFDRYIVAGERVEAEDELTALYQKESEQMGTLTFAEHTTEFFADPDGARERAVHCEETMMIGDRQ